MNVEATYEVYAVKYAERDGKRSDHFLGGDPHDGPMPMDYFVWAVVGEHHTWVVDTGFAEHDAQLRGRTLIRSVTEALAVIGVKSESVNDVVVTHMHYDHIGGFDQFPNARFHVQDREMAYATGRNMTKSNLRHPFTVDHVAGLVERVHEGRVVFHDGDAELADGLTVHWVGGHTDGLQVVRVNTQIGHIVLASDATHYYENMAADRPFPFVYNVGDMLYGYDRMRQLADNPSWIIPGHDPEVFNRYAPPSPELTGIAVCLHLEPAEAR